MREQGFFPLMQTGKAYSCGDIAEEIAARPGPLECCLDLFLVMGWMERAAGEYVIKDKISEEAFIPGWMARLYDHDFVDVVSGRGAHAAFEKGLERLVTGWECEDPLEHMLDGAVMIPLLLGLVQGGWAEDVKKGTLEKVPLAQWIRDIFRAKRWGSEENGVFRLSGVGKFMLDRCMVTGVTASYRPMLANISQMLFTDEFYNDDSKAHRYVDRTLNVRSSGFQHERYFRDLEKTIIYIFSDLPVDEQPDYIADMGCGDGTLLKNIYDIIQNKSNRGEYLDQHPIVMIGLDFDEKALNESSLKLQGIPHILLKGDVGDPGSIFRDLEKKGVTRADKIMHVRSFLDHNRLYKGGRDAEGVRRWSRLPFEGRAIGPDGASLPQPAVMQDLTEHLGRWSRILGRFGLLVLEVHAQPVPVKRAFFDTDEGFHFDFLHTISGQYLCESEYFLVAMAQNGLFADKVFRRYPKGFPFTRITLGYFEKRNYSIRFATDEDVIEVPSNDKSHQRDTLTRSGTVNEAPEICFTLFDTKGDICSAVICSYCDSSQEKARRVLLESVLGSEDDLDYKDVLMDFLIQYLRLKADVEELIVRSDPFWEKFIQYRESLPFENEVIDGSKVYKVALAD